MVAKKKKYFSKEVKYSGKKVTLFSLDGQVWSTRKEELAEIMERHENERASYGDQIVGGPQAKIPTQRPKTTAVNAKRAAPSAAKTAEEKKAKKPQKTATKVAAPKKTKSKAKKSTKSSTAGKKKKAAAPKKRASGKPTAKAKSKKSKKKVA